MTFFEVATDNNSPGKVTLLNNHNGISAENKWGLTGPRINVATPSVCTLRLDTINVHPILTVLLSYINKHSVVMAY